MANRFFKVPIELNRNDLRYDLGVTLAGRWTSHFNNRDYNGNWTVISLRSTSGAVTDITSHPDLPFVNTPLMEDCRYFKNVIDSLKCDKESVRLLRLGPGSVIHTHRDRGTGYSHGNFRLHIPLLSRPGVAFIVDGEEVPMQEGECWYADFDLPHSVQNNSNDERIHLVIDCIRNESTDELFKRAGYDFSAERRGPDAQTLQRMIGELERMNTEASRNMIVELKRQLSGT